MNLKEEIKKYQKTLVSRKSTFYMSGYIMDEFCATSSFLVHGMGLENDFSTGRYLLLRYVGGQFISLNL